MFPRKNRLKKTSFLIVSRRGNRYFTTNFSVTVSSETNGYAVVVSKKIARLAVTRHKIKRRVLEAIKTLNLPLAAIIYPKATVRDMSFKDILAELEVLLHNVTNVVHQKKIK